MKGWSHQAKRRLKDAQVEALSEESRFLLAYDAAHTLATAALRWHGYRSENRYLVFQCTQHTVGLDKAKWLVLDKCHKQRNLAEYEGQLDVNRQLLLELTEITTELLELAEALGPVKNE
ncbi:hypothetical protein [Thiohalophilus sp.]|uniref:hypothetical protein n=1 Tax=Thiohalophilus sp. TaxID=3028392 RepID=UPI0039761057